MSIKSALSQGGALHALTQYPQFILYKLPDKVPFRADNPHQACDPHDPTNWCSAEIALAWVEYYGAGWGVGFVLTENDPFWCLDIDKCNQGGTWSTTAIELCGQFASAAIEVSVSGNGLHIWGSGTVPAHRKKNTSERLELYTEARFMALSGMGAQGDASTRHDAAMQALVSQYFAPDVADQSVPVADEGPCEGWNGPTDDVTLIERALRSQSAASTFGGRASFRDLWERNVSALARAYPPNDPADLYDGSSADAALAQHLAFWTGKDASRIERLMRQSGLVRDKWDRHRDYMRMTVSSACARQVDVLRDRVLGEPVEVETDHYVTHERYKAMIDAASTAAEVEHAARAAAVDASLPATLGRSLAKVLKDRFALFGLELSLDDCRAMLRKPTVAGDVDDLSWAREWVFIRSTRELYRPGKGVPLTTMAFDHEYATRTPINLETGKRGKPYEYARQLGVIPAVDHKAYDPTEGDLYESDGLRYVNTYRRDLVPQPAEQYSHEGVSAIERFRRHLRILLGNERDATMLEAVIAHYVRSPGVLLKVAVLIHGLPGCGKTLIADAIGHMVGKENTGRMSGAAMRSGFTSWANRTSLMVLEEIREVGQSKHEVLNALKQFITNETVTIHPKGMAEYDAPNRTNYIGYTNFEDALPVDNEDRRWWIMSAPYADKAAFLAALPTTPEAYFTQLFNDIETHACELKKFFTEHPGHPEVFPGMHAPMTVAKVKMIEAAAHPAMGLYRDLVDGLDVVDTAALGRRITMEDETIKLPQTHDVSRIMRALGFHPCERYIKHNGKRVKPWVKRREWVGLTEHEGGRYQLREALIAADRKFSPFGGGGD